jgi:hypothetical protein
MPLFIGEGPNNRAIGSAVPFAMSHDNEAEGFHSHYVKVIRDNGSLTLINRRRITQDIIDKFIQWRG